MTSAPTAEFLAAARGRLFVVVFGDVATARSRVLVAPALGDEMNKSRHLVAEVGRRLAAAGVATIVPDLHGTGDSDGEFAEATWAGWCADLESVCATYAARGAPIDALLAVRAGTLLGLRALAAARVPVRRAVLWQPVVDGGRHLTQLLRMRTAAGMTGGARETVDSLRQRLAAGETLEVAGYELSPGVATGLDVERATPFVAGFPGELHWIEIAGGDAPAVTPASAAVVNEAVAAGVRVRACALGGEPFWGSAELVRNEALVSSTVAALGAAA